MPGTIQACLLVWLFFVKLLNSQNPLRGLLWEFICMFVMKVKEFQIQTWQTMGNSGFHDEILQHRSIYLRRWDEYYTLIKINEEILSLTRELEFILFLLILWKVESLSVLSFLALPLYKGQWYKTISQCILKLFSLLLWFYRIILG